MRRVIPILAGTVIYIVGTAGVVVIGATIGRTHGAAAANILAFAVGIPVGLIAGSVAIVIWRGGP